MQVDKEGPIEVTKSLLLGVLSPREGDEGLGIKDVANALIESGDLDNMVDEEADLFLKFMLQLSVECSTICTMLALISKENRRFPLVVLEKLSKSFCSALNSDDVLVSKLRYYRTSSDSLVAHVTSDGTMNELYTSSKIYAKSRISYRFPDPRPHAFITPSLLPYVI